MASVIVLAAAAACCCILLAASVSPASPAPVVYSVGDERGWAVPAGNGTETYNHWAKKNRFQVGDVLDFKYAAKDSVLLVNHDDYKMCSTVTPLTRFADGDTKFKFDRTGFFFFVSGVPGHCEAGQRMIASVVGHSTLAAAPAKPPAVGVVGGHAPGPSPSPNQAVSAPESPSYGSSSGGSTSTTGFGPSPSTEPSGASRRALSTVTGLVASVVAMIALA
ncbi:early nodulin-like protein 1 [Triticum urartu]|uniref:early nodulin-like protein 1 n=1 Tax=Triticum urartu TaxID=4572 RepID=UPI0020437A6A|nr:early nodulin-like protein 1 [Triticum urartu]